VKAAACIVRRDVATTAVELHPNALLARVLAARGVQSADEMNFSTAALPAFDTLPNVTQAVTRLVQAIDRQERVLVVGDYDCDGATSTTLAILALRSMGAAAVDYLVPNRFDYGYGLSPEIVDVAATMSPDLILTVDNGVASNAGVDRANALGIDVVVTDHHLPPDELPAAVAIVNPNLAGSCFPGGALAGVGVVFYVMLALRARLKHSGAFAGENQEPRLAELLDLVAIGTVADVVPLDHINRTLVEQGLRRIRAGRSRPGVEALCAVAGRDPAQLAAMDIGFALAPRLNAAGRLDDISIGIQCLLAESQPAAATLADDLNTLNQQRRTIEHGMRLEADVLVARTLEALPRGKSPMSLCLFEPHWHQGVIGILAGRLKDELNIPVIVFAAAEGGLPAASTPCPAHVESTTADPTTADSATAAQLMLKGSARSVPGLHIRDALMSVVARHPGLLKNFGGHAMAAGLTLSHANLQAFAAAFDQAVRVALDDEPPSRQWLTDGELDISEFTLEHADLIRFYCPWGQDFPQPVFDGEFTIKGCRVLKDRHLKMQLQLPGTELELDAIAFNQSLDQAQGRTLRMVYRLEANTFRGQHTLQLLVLYIDA